MMCTTAKRGAEEITSTLAVPFAEERSVRLRTGDRCFQEEAQCSTEETHDCAICLEFLIDPVVGVCRRLKHLLEKLYPERTASRRAELLEQQAAKARQQEAKVEAEVEAQVANIQSILHPMPGPSSPAAMVSSPLAHALLPGLQHGISSLPASTGFPNPQFQHQHQPAPLPHHQPVPEVSSTPQWLTWHFPAADVDIRQACTEELVRIFHQRRPNMDANFRLRLSGFVRRLEENLYRSSTSREQYINMTTLEQRVQQVARRLIQRQSSAIARGVELPQWVYGATRAPTFGSHGQPAVASVCP